jgi:hypothetical protein
MKRPEIRKSRKLLSEFSSSLDSEMLSVRIYHDGESFTCERSLVERDGTSLTMVLPFTEPQAARTFLTADPYYSRVRSEIGQVLVRLDRIWRSTNGKKLY